MDKWQYLMLLGGCLLLTLPLEFTGDGVYRQPKRLLRAMVPVVVVFLIWDAVAIAQHVWHYNPRFVSGINVPFMPLEEMLFFIVIPLCGLLTYNIVTASLAKMARMRRRDAGRSDR